jgi:hypothetical protein
MAQHGQEADMLARAIIVGLIRNGSSHRHRGRRRLMHRWVGAAGQRPGLQLETTQPGHYRLDVERFTVVARAGQCQFDVT